MKPSPWLIRQPGPSRQFRLFCFSYAGGSASTYLPWQAEIDPSIEVCAIQLPGRGARLGEPAIASMPELVRVLATEIAQHSDRPFAFFGHSLGALVAFELARFCKLNYIATPAHLFVSACNAPQHRNPPEGLHLLSQDALIEKLRAYNGTPPEILRHHELMGLVLPAIRADFALVDNYRYRSSLPLAMPVTALAGRRDAHVSHEQVVGWRKETTNAFNVRWFDGDHFFIHAERDAVLDCIGAELLEAQCA